MSFDTAPVKPTVNFPEAHPYWAGLLLGVATVPVFIVLSEPLAQQWGAPARPDWGSLCRFRGTRRPTQREPRRVGRRPAFAGVGLAGLRSIRS